MTFGSIYRPLKGVTTMDRILAPIDGSRHALKALDLACDLAVKFGAKLSVIYVISEQRLPPQLRHMVEVEHLTETSPPDLPAPGGLSGGLGAALQKARSAETDRAAHEALGKRLLDEAERTAVLKGLKGTETTLVYGDPASEILALANAAKADMIVMGSRGLSNLKGLLVGSVSHKVMHLADCTCVTVK
jgi:nucleotide-binding universal stress UspA family protein